MLEHMKTSAIALAVCLAATGCAEHRQSSTAPSPSPTNGPFLPAGIQHKVPAVGRLYKDCTVGVSSECELHHVQMQRESVAVVAYGFMPANFTRTPYSHGGQPVDSGCVGPGEGPVYGYVWVCPQCEHAWVRAGRPRS